jgi:hypothetical protein
MRSVRARTLGRVGAAAAARPSGSLAAVVLAAAVLAAPAGAEPVIELGTGRQASAVTDAAGTLHVVSRDPAADRVPLRYCRVPAGGSACAPLEIARDAQWAPRLLLRPQDGVLIVVYPGLDAASQLRTMLVLSPDGGTTWSAATPIGMGLSEIDDAELSPDGAFVDTVASTATGEVQFQRVGLAGGLEQRVVPLGVKKDLLAPRVTHLADGRPVVIAHYAADRLGARAARLGADPNDPSAWGSATTFHRLRNADASDGDAGPTGTWLLATVKQRTSAGALPVAVWRWGARGFEDPRTIGALARRAGQQVGQGQDTNVVSLDVDLAGRLHTAWPLSQRDCGGHLCIVYRRTDRRGFMAPIVYPVGTATADTVQHFAVAANSGGSGWLVWDDLSARVRAVPLVTPPLGSRVGSRRIGRRRVSIPDFYGCVPTGGTFVHRLRVDGRPGTRIVSVRFFFDAGQPSRTDHRAPYRLRFRLGFPPGSRHVAAAVVRYRLPGERRVRSVRIGRTFVMC